MVRCDMCMNERHTSYRCSDGSVLELCNSCYQLMIVKEEVKKLNQFWVDKYNELKHVMSVAIGIRNNKIKELNVRINKCEFMIENELNPRYIHLDKRIETLEKQIRTVVEKHVFKLYFHKYWIIIINYTCIT